MMTTLNFNSVFSDKRLVTRGHQLLSSLYQIPSCSIQQIATTRAEQIGYYRFLSNSKVCEKKLSAEIGVRCSQAVKDKTVLCIQDSSEVNLFHHSNRIKKKSGLGVIDASSKKGIGFKVHPCLVVDATTHFPYGYAGIDVFHREAKEKLSYSEQCKQPIMERESGKWIRGNERAGLYLSEAKQVIIIQDREGDIYEQFLAGALAPNTDLLVRCQYNRKLMNEDDKLWETLSKEVAAGIYTTKIAADSHKKTKAREAIMEVRIVKVNFKKPSTKVADMATQSRDVYAIEAKEITAGIDNPIHWRLLTTYCTIDFETAQKVIGWYTCRWMIEEVFKVLKKECYDIESSELEQGWAIRKLTILILETIIKLFQMLIIQNTANEETESIKSSVAFTLDEITCLKILNKTVEGSKEKQQNPNNVEQLKGATWVIARLGGWKGYQSQRKPGATTLLIGLEKFYIFCNAYKQISSVCTR